MDSFEVHLRRHEDGGVVRGILREMDPALDLKHWEESWKPLLSQSIEQDRKWDWSEKFMNLHTVNYEFYAVECEEMTQGLMIIDLDFHRTRTGNLNLVYVNFIATAPWNRKALMKKPKFKGVGPLLLRHALVRSEELGYNFRAGLHSLPSSEWFYDVLGLDNYGQDKDAGNFKYYEFSEKKGQDFVEGR